MSGLTLYYGKSFTGKTARMVHEVQEEESRVFLIDPKCAQLMKLRGWDHLTPTYDAEAGRWQGHAVSDALHACISGSFKIVIHLRHSYREQLELFCRMVRAVRHCVLAVDELGLFIPPGPAGALPPNITSVIVSGTHEGIRFCGTAQRPSLVHATVRAQASRIFFYRMTEASDVAVSEAMLGPGFDVTSLPDYVCVDWQDGRDPFIDGDYVGRLGKVLPGSR